MTRLAIKLSGAVSTAHAALRGTRLFLWTDFDKRIRRCIPKSCFPSDCAGKCVRLQIEVCSEVFCCYSVSQSDCHTEHTILMLTVAWHCTLVLLLCLQNEKDKVMHLCCSYTSLIIHSFSSAGHVCCIIYYMCILSFFSKQITKLLNIIKPIKKCSFHLS